MAKEDLSFFDVLNKAINSAQIDPTSITPEMSQKIFNVLLNKKVGWYNLSDIPVVGEPTYNMLLAIKKNASNLDDAAKNSITNVLKGVTSEGTPGGSLEKILDYDKDYSVDLLTSTADDYISTLIEGLKSLAKDLMMNAEGLTDYDLKELDIDVNKIITNEIVTPILEPNVVNVLGLVVDRIRDIYRLNQSRGKIQEGSMDKELIETDIMEAMVKKKVVVRGGKKAIIKAHKRRRMTPAQRRALAKARRKANKPSAKRLRAKSMKKRKNLGMKECVMYTNEMFGLQLGKQYVDIPEGSVIKVVDVGEGFYSINVTAKDGSCVVEGYDLPESFYVDALNDSVLDIMEGYNVENTTVSEPVVESPQKVDMVNKLSISGSTYTLTVGDDIFEGLSRFSVREKAKGYGIDLSSDVFLKTRDGEVLL